MRVENLDYQPLTRFERMTDDRLHRFAEVWLQRFNGTANRFHTWILTQPNVKIGICSSISNRDKELLELHESSGVFRAIRAIAVNPCPGWV